MNFENQPSEPFKQDINEYNPRYTFPLENQDDYRGLIRFLAYDEDYQSLAGLAFRTAAVAGVKISTSSEIKQKLNWRPKIDINQGIKFLLNDINYWKKAPVWTPKKINNATKLWFKHLK